MGAAVEFSVTGRRVRVSRWEKDFTITYGDGRWEEVVFHPASSALLMVHHVWLKIEKFLSALVMV